MVKRKGIYKEQTGAIRKRVGDLGDPGFDFSRAWLREQIPVDDRDIGHQTHMGILDQLCLAICSNAPVDLIHHHIHRGQTPSRDDCRQERRF